MSHLRLLEVGDECFEYVDEVKLIGLSKLERVVIGENSFTKERIIVVMIQIVISI